MVPSTPFKLFRTQASQRRVSCSPHCSWRSLALLKRWKLRITRFTGLIGFIGFIRISCMGAGLYVVARLLKNVSMLEDLTATSGTTTTTSNFTTYPCPNTESEKGPFVDYSSFSRELYGGPCSSAGGEIRNTP